MQYPDPDPATASSGQDSQETRQRVEKFHMRESMDVYPWPEAPTQLCVAPELRFEQDMLFNGVGVCQTLCILYAEFRLRAMRLREIMAELRRPAARETILQLQEAMKLGRSHGHGDALKQTAYMKGPHQHMQGMFPVGGVNCPILREVGCFPEGFSYYKNQGRRGFAVRGPGRHRFQIPALPAPARALRSDEDYLESITPPVQAASIFPMLLRHRVIERHDQLFLLAIHGAYDEFEPYRGHAVILDLTNPGSPAIFDPNRGIIPLTKGYNQTMEVTLVAIAAEMEASGIVAMQFVKGPLPCHCGANRPAEKKHYR